MAKRGRPSGEDNLGVVVQADFGGRPEPPPELTADAAKLWRELVAMKPAGYFRGTEPLLASYCRVTMSAAHIALRMATIDLATASAAELATLNSLATLRANEAKLMMLLARTMRLTQHSRISARSAGRASDDAPPSKKPWETNFSDE